MEFWRAIGNQLRVIDVRNVAAAFGFIHVMGSHKKSNAVAGKFKQQIPQLPPRDGIDSRGRFIQEKQFRLVAASRNKCQPLLPSAGKLCCQPVQILLESIQ